MRMSCNGCRVLRKGCNDNCAIRPCLQFIPNPLSQANATLFLAKFYGRAGLINLINAGPEHLRPEIFKSLLYEACGRIVDPINGSVGLALSGSWHLCQAAVDAVLDGKSISKVAAETASSGLSFSPPLKACDIRHVPKDNNKSSSSSDQQLRKVKSRKRFKRSAKKPTPKMEPEAEVEANCKFSDCFKNEARESASHDSALSRHPSEGDSVSVETVEVSLMKAEESADGSDVELELTLGINPQRRKVQV